MSTENPYRYLFPLGWLSSAGGVGLWIAFRHGWISAYPREAHAELMVGGFLLSFVVGFLWTAGPRFLQAPPAKPGELAALTATMALVSLFGLLNALPALHLADLFALLLTFRFVRRRYRLRRTSPPGAFAFVAAGLGLAFLSLLVRIASDGGLLAAESLAVGIARAFFFKGFPLCLVLGIGSRLIPALLGHAPAPTEGAGGWQDTLRVRPILAMLLLGLAAEPAGFPRLTGVALAIALTTAALGPFRLASLPAVRSWLAWLVWASGWILAIGPLALAVVPTYAVHLWHLVFIGGLGLLTLTVGCRVTLAHSGQAFQPWERKPPIGVIGALVLLAAATRVAAPFLQPERILEHYEYAAADWLLALLIWAAIFLRFTPWRSPGKEEAEQC